MRLPSIPTLFITILLSSSASALDLSDSYLVVLKNTTNPSTFASHRAWASRLHSSRLHRRSDPSLSGITHTYSTLLTGYAGTFDEHTIAAIEARPEVEYVERDSLVHASALVIQENTPTWGLPRISQKGPQASIESSRYYYDNTAGQGTVVYIIDTGVQTTHTEFEGRAVFGTDFSNSGPGDSSGHGTHVAGTAAGKTYGVAKKATVVSVRVLDAAGSGATSWVLAGIEWVINDARARGKLNKAVANMSLGGAYSAAVNRAVANAVASGVVVVAAAGGDGTTNGGSPSSEPSAITVGAMAQGDTRASFSNYGPGIDVWAPGVNIKSAWVGGSNDGTATLSGTSMAAAHVSGVAAYLMGLENLASPAAVDVRIKQLAWPGVSNVPSGTTNKMVWNGAKE